MLDVKAYGLLFCYNAKKMGRYMMGWGCSGGRSTKGAYKEMFDKEPYVRVIHAGLECGIISTNYPGMDMVSFGPTLMSPHSPTERVYIPTVEMFYSLVRALVVNGVL